MALIQTNAQLLAAPQTGGFINSGFTASGEYDTYMPFTATQKVVYNTLTPTAISLDVEFNDGSWDHGGDMGFMISGSGDWSNMLEVSSISAILQPTANYPMTSENIRFSYDKYHIDDNFCGKWYMDSNTHEFTAVISGFGASGKVPEQYPIYISFPYTTRNKGETSPITISGDSGSDPSPVYPQYPLTSTGYFSSHTYCTGEWRRRYPWESDINRVASGWYSAEVKYDAGPDSASTKNTWDDYYIYPNYADTWMYELAKDHKYNFQGDTGYSYATGAVQTAWRGYPSDSGSITP